MGHWGHFRKCFTFVHHPLYLQVHPHHCHFVLRPPLGPYYFHFFELQDLHHYYYCQYLLIHFLQYLKRLCCKCLNLSHLLRIHHLDQTFQTSEGKSSMYWTASCDERRFLVMLIYKWKKKTFFRSLFILYIRCIQEKPFNNTLEKIWNNRIFIPNMRQCCIYATY